MRATAQLQALDRLAFRDWPFWRAILTAYLAGFIAFHPNPYPRLALAEFADVGISEHTGKVCDA